PATDHEKQCAIYQLAAGRINDYRRRCAQMISRDGSTSDATVAGDILYGVLPSPDSVADFTALLPLARTAVGMHGGGERILAATLCRAGKFAEAIEQFRLSQRVWPPRAWDLLFMAMCHHQLGDDRRATECFRKAQDWMAKADELRTKGIKGSWEITWF